MSAEIKVISDLHFNHKNMAIRRGFKDENEMNQHIIKKWNENVKKHDSVYILGDITMEKKKGYELLNELNGNKFIILGNHDRRQDVKELLKYVNGVAGMINYKNSILTHCPVHENELKYRYKYNIHGHVHENSITKLEWRYLDQKDKEIIDMKYINVCAEVIDYIPLNINNLIENRNKNKLY